MTKPNAIEEIMARDIEAVLREAGLLGQTAANLAIKLVQDQLAALDAAGLAVVPKEATHGQVMATPASVSEPRTRRTYAAAVAAFDPTAWTPKP